MEGMEVYVRLRALLAQFLAMYERLVDMDGKRRSAMLHWVYYMSNITTMHL
jgi:hypothetical protein